MRENPNLNKANITNDEAESYSYYSKKLDKVFDTLEALREAEREEAKKQAAKELAASERKTAAKKVEDAYQALRDATNKRDTKIAAAQKAYLKEQAELKKSFNELIANIDKEVEEVKTAYNKTLKEFTDKYGDFHATFKDDNGTVTIHRSQQPTKDFWSDFIDFFLRG